MSEEFNLDLMYGVTPEMQDDIDKLKADPFELKPNKEGFVPSALVKEPKEGSDERSAWWNTENAEVISTQISPLTDKETQAVRGQSVRVTYRVIDGPNEGKTIDSMWWMEDDDPESVQRANSEVQALFDTMKVKPKVVDSGRRHPETGEPILINSFIGVIDRLEGKRCRLRIRQKWGHKWKKTAGGFVELTDEPMQFTKRIVDVYSA